MLKTIISNNCFGGVIARSNNMKFCSPTVNLQILPEEFPRFCANLKHYMDAEVRRIRLMNLGPRHTEYMHHMFSDFPNCPLGLVDDIVVVFQHYDTFDEAKEAWDRRKTRIDYDSICYLFHAKNESYKPCVEEFLALNLPHSAVITEDWGMDGTHRFDVPKGSDAFGGRNGKRYIEQNFNIKEFLEVDR